jgi:hypothetical protein
MASKPSPKITDLLKVLAWSNTLDICETERIRRRRIYEAELKKLQLEVEEVRALHLLWEIKRDVKLNDSQDLQGCLENARIVVERNAARDKWLQKVYLFG